MFTISDFNSICAEDGQERLTVKKAKNTIINMRSRME